MADALIRVAPFYYIHILDNNTNIQRVEVGPQTFTRLDHEKILLNPTAMVVIPPRHYVVIEDPYVRKDERTKEPEVEHFGQVKLRYGDVEIRFADDWPNPFPLLPGERMRGSVMKMTVIAQNAALRLVARRDFNDEGVARKAGDEWLVFGPATYKPRVEVEVTENVTATVIEQDHALRLQARKEFTDRAGRLRKAGEEWLVREMGSYLPDVDERVVGVVKPNFLLQTKALHLRALDNFSDVYGIERKAGEEWLVTDKLAEVHLQDTYEEIVGAVSLTVLSKLQYAVILDPSVEGRNQYGTKELRKGETSFFLLPGERLDKGIQNVYVLGEEEALLLKAVQPFQDTGSPRVPGDLWMINGPCDYVPPVEVEVVEKRVSIPLDENEGIYVRDSQTGELRAVSGETYLLKAHEVLWEKDLPQDVEDLLRWSNADEDDKSASKPRNKTRVVDYRVPHNSAVQIYDYKLKKSRVVFGPDMVLLSPDEQFTVLSLSGDKPKRANVIKTIALQLGPDFMTDILEVETSDHARLRLQLSYNWHFEVDPNDPGKIFQVRDFVGDACKAIASRVRGAVASRSFDQIHKSSARLIRKAVFGETAAGKIGDKFLFTANNLCITNVDIQSVEPVDERTRESLQKSVQLAIEITTRKQERNARHDAEKIEQDAKGKIERQKIENQRGGEEERQQLIELQAKCKGIEVSGTAKAEAEARAKKLDIEASMAVTQAELTADASNIEAQASLEETTQTQEAEMEHSRTLSDLELTKARQMAEIETTKFEELVAAIRPETIKAIARAGPEMQARLLKALGLKGYLMTDGNSPINLFNAAKGMIGGPSMGAM